MKHHTATLKIIIAIVVALLIAAPHSASLAEEPEEGFVALFDGKSLQGWDGNPEVWSVVDGAIRGMTSDKMPIQHNEFLIWDGQVADFVLRLEFRIADRGIGNSGVQYRSKRHKDKGRWVVGGYQADIERTNKYMGILYEEGGRGILAVRGDKVVLDRDSGQLKKQVVGSTGNPAELVQGVNAGEWQSLEITTQGNQLEHKLNGRTMVYVTDNDEAHSAQEGVVALQVHTGPEMQIEFRNIRLKDTTHDKSDM